MARKILAMPLLVLGMAFFVQCTDETFSSEADRVIILAGKGGGGGGGGHTEPVGNNLSFPVFAVDGFSISTITNPSFQTVYAGPYTDLSDEEKAIALSCDWYAQKVEGNVWQAEFSNSDGSIDITFIDWGDVIEASKPVTGRPFRLETTLYVDISDAPMDGYTMALLAFPSSPNETQGTNNVTYDGNWATVASTSPTLIIQYLAAGAEPTWDPAGKWIGDGVAKPLENFTFAPELNVGGKYIYGASTGGWRPTDPGKYRLTFFMRGPSSNISLASAVIGNYAGNTKLVWGEPENRASTPVVDAANNLSYVDVEVVRKR